MTSRPRLQVRFPRGWSTVVCLVAATVALRAQEPRLAMEAEAAPAGWHQAFEDRFERSELGARWHILGGGWRLADGRLQGVGELLLALRFEGDQRLEFDAGSEAPGDLSAILAAGAEGVKSGIFFGFGSNGNTKSKLLVAGDERLALPATAVPGRGYHIVCQREGSMVTWTVNGETLLRRDLDGLPQGPRQARVGLYLWRHGWIDNVKVFLRDTAAAAAVRRRLEEWVWQHDFEGIAAAAVWQPEPADAGLEAKTQGGGLWQLRPEIGSGASQALEAVRPKDALTTLLWTPDSESGFNDIRFRVSIPAAGSGVDVVFGVAAGALANIRISLKEGIELRTGGGAWGSRMTLVPVLDFVPGRWYTVRHQLDLDRDLIRARIDERSWTGWMPFVKGKRAARLGSVLFYAYESGPGGVSCRVDDLAAAVTEPDDVTVRDYALRLDAARNTLVLNMRMLDEQGEALFLLADEAEPLAALLFDDFEISLFSGRDDGRRVPLLRGAGVRPGTDYRVEIQFDFAAGRYRGRVGNTVWSRWFGFAADATVAGFAHVRLIPFAPQDRPDVVLISGIYSRYTELPPPPAPDAVAAQVIHNGSFETIVPGLWGFDPDGTRAPPDNWIVERRARADRIETITETAATGTAEHGGKRHLRVVPGSAEGVRLHNLKYGGLEYEPGVVYTVSFRARASGAEPVRIEVAPPGVTVTVTESGWKRYEWRYRHESTAEPRLGFRLHIRGGGLDLDDVSVLPEALEPLPVRAWFAAPAAARTQPADAWPAGYRERVTVRILNPADEAVAAAPVAVELRQLWPAFQHRFVAADRILVVNPARRDEAVVWALLESDAASGATARDRLVFAGDCPPGGQALYHVYLRDRDSVEADTVLPMQLPPPLQGRVAPGLDVEVTDRENSFEVACDWVDGTLRGRVRAVHAGRCRATLISPAQEQVPAEVRRVAADPSCWSLQADPERMESGVWQLTVTAGDRSETVALARGPCLWGGPGIQRILADSAPRSGPVRVAAARGESERFQALLRAGDQALERVELALGPLRHEETGTLIELEPVIWRQATVSLLRGNASISGTVGGYKWHAAACSRVGEYPDPLLPWRSVTVPAGSRTAAWIVVRVPVTAAAGLYRGALAARAADGTALELPVELEVFDFVLPARRRFVPALGADVHGPLPAGAELDRVCWDIAVLLAERGMAPWLYGMRQSPYNVEWRYDPRTDEASFDFARLDRNLAILIDEYDLRTLFFKFHQPGGPRPGYVYDSSEDFVRIDSEQGRRMLTHWLRAVGEHLQERGWLERAHMYIADEIERDLDTITADLARRIRETSPGMKTWALSAVTGDWWQYMDHTDVFGGPISDVNLQRFREQGGSYWGSYNRPWLIGVPLWTVRVIGLDSFCRGATGYAHWAVTRWPNRPWVNGASALRPDGANPDRGGSHFMFGVFAPGMASILYPWPTDDAPPRRPEDPVVLPSLRLEALAEGIDDYEYAALLADVAAEDEAAAALLNRLRALVAAGNLGGDFTHHAPTHAVFETDEAAFLALRTEIGRFLARSLHEAFMQGPPERP